MKRSIGRSILAVVAGYLAMALAVTLGLTLLLAAAPGAFPAEAGPYQGPVYVLAIELAFSLLAAVGGGYVCGWIARSQERKHAVALAGLTVLLGTASAFAEAGLKPLWSAIGLMLVAPLGVLIGASLRQRHRERDALRNRA